MINVNNTRDKSNGLSVKNDNRKDNYTSYNSLSGKYEVKSVSQEMRQYIKDGFAKLSIKKHKP